MHILLDLIPLKSGGGAQVGLGLIDAIQRKDGYGHVWHALVTEGTAADLTLADGHGFESVTRVPPGNLSRLNFERLLLPRLLRRLRPDAVYSQFGPGLPTNGIPRVVGSAYSNLYFPEVPFWHAWPLRNRMLFELRDRFRLRRTLQADGWIFETDPIAQRAVELFALPKERVTVVRPSPGTLVQPNRRHAETAERCRKLPDGYRILMLSGWHLNKGLTIVPAVAQELKERHGVNDIVFVLTISPEHPASKSIMADAEARGVAKNIVLFGSVPPEGCVELYRATQCLLLLSLLESFSNNMIESWVMERPLLITDAEWSRGTCGAAAHYVDRDDPEDIAAGILQVRQDPAYAASLVRAGVELLASYPSLADKVQQYVDFIERIISLGKLGARVSNG